MSTQNPIPPQSKAKITNNNDQTVHAKIEGEPTAKPLPKKEHKGYEDMGLLEPTRYGDWDVKGRCSDF